jgi:hypothetical protein
MDLEINPIFHHHFCAYCLADCDRDVHAHVAGCAHNSSPGRDVFGDWETSETAQQARRQHMVQAYIDTLEARLRERVLAACRQDLLDLGVQVVWSGECNAFCSRLMIARVHP